MSSLPPPTKRTDENTGRLCARQSNRKRRRKNNGGRGNSCVPSLCGMRGRDRPFLRSAERIGGFVDGNDGTDDGPMARRSVSGRPDPPSAASVLLSQDAVLTMTCGIACTTEQLKERPMIVRIRFLSDDQKTDIGWKQQVGRPTLDSASDFPGTDSQTPLFPSHIEPVVLQDSQHCYPNAVLDLSSADKYLPLRQGQDWIVSVRGYVTASRPPLPKYKPDLRPWLFIVDFVRFFTVPTSQRYPHPRTKLKDAVATASLSPAALAQLIAKLSYYRGADRDVLTSDPHSASDGPARPLNASTATNNPKPSLRRAKATRPKKAVKVVPHTWSASTDTVPGCAITQLSRLWQYCKAHSSVSPASTRYSDSASASASAALRSVEHLLAGSLSCFTSRSTQSASPASANSTVEDTPPDRTATDATAQTSNAYLRTLQEFLNHTSAMHALQHSLANTATATASATATDNDSMVFSDYNGQEPHATNASISEPSDSSARVTARVPSIASSTSADSSNTSNTSNNPSNESLWYASPTQQTVQNFMSSLDEFILSQRDRQKASLTSNAGRESAERSVKVVDNYEAAMGVALAKKDHELSIDFLNNIHETLLRGLHDRAGQLRDSMVRAGSTLFCPPERLLQELAAFERIADEWSSDLRLLRASHGSRWSNSLIMAGLVYTAMIMFGVVDIHPYSDGNGRLSRIACNWALAKSLNFPFWLTLFATSAQRASYVIAHEQVRHNLSLVARGTATEADLNKCLLRTGVLQPLVTLLLNQCNLSLRALSQVWKAKLQRSVEASQDQAARVARETAARSDCLICLEGSPHIATLCCGKAVHLPCLATWLSERSNCPVCRADMPRMPRPVSRNGPAGRRRGVNGSNGGAVFDLDTIENAVDSVIRELEHDPQVESPLRGLDGGGIHRRRYIVEDGDINDTGTDDDEDDASTTYEIDDGMYYDDDDDDDDDDEAEAEADDTEDTGEVVSAGGSQTGVRNSRARARRNMLRDDRHLRLLRNAGVEFNSDQLRAIQGLVQQSVADVLSSMGHGNGVVGDSGDTEEDGNEGAEEDEDTERVVGHLPSMYAPGSESEDTSESTDDESATATTTMMRGGANDVWREGFVGNEGLFVGDAESTSVAVPSRQVWMESEDTEESDVGNRFDDTADVDGRLRNVDVTEDTTVDGVVGGNDDDEDADENADTVSLRMFRRSDGVGVRGYCREVRCGNRAAMDCTNHRCGRCCYMSGQFQCARHNT